MDAGDEEAANELLEEKLRGGWVKKILTRLIRLERASAVRVHNPITALRVDEALAYYSSVTTADMIEWLDGEEPSYPEPDPVRPPFNAPPPVGDPTPIGGPVGGLQEVICPNQEDHELLGEECPAPSQNPFFSPPALQYVSHGRKERLGERLS